MLSARVAVPYAVVVVGDPKSQEIPAEMGGSVIAATGDSVAVACRPDIDGETEFRLGAWDEVAPDAEPAFIGRLPTPTRRVTIQSASSTPILEMAVPTNETTVGVWVNDPMERYQVIVALGNQQR